MSRELEERTVEKETLGPLTIRVVYDDTGVGNPRDNDNLGVIVSWNRDGFGDHQERDGGYPEGNYGTVRNRLVAEYDAIAETIAPLSFVNYGGGWPGTTLRVISDLDEADGAIFATPASTEMTGCTGEDWPPEKVRASIVEEVKEYEQWMQGEVFAWIVEKDGEVLDSCTGYIGETEYPLQEARAEAEARPEYQRAVIGSFAGKEGLGL